MAQLKDLLVNGVTRLVGDTIVNKIQITSISAPTSAGGSTYGPGTSGQVLKSNGTSVYWGTDSNGSLTINLTQSGESYSIDKTYDEIKAALESGMNCVVLYNANNHIYYYPFNHQDYNFSTQEFIYYFANSYVYDSTTAANEGCKIYKQNNTTVVQSYHSAFSRTVVNSPQAPTETFVLYYDDEESKWVLNQSQSGIGDMSDAMEYDIIISLKKELTHSDSYYEENSEWYYLTRKYVTEVYSEEYGENIYTGHLVFQSVIEDNGVKKIKTITVSDYFDQYDYLGNATITFSEEVVNITYCCNATLSSAGWYRVFTVNGTDDEILGIDGFAIDINLMRSSVNTAGETHKIRLSTPYNQFVFSDESSNSRALGITKIRYTSSSSGGHIDIYFALSNSDTVYADFCVHVISSKQSNFIAESMQAVANAPSGETVRKEYTFAANTNGDVTSSYSITKSTGRLLTLDSAYRYGNVVHMQITAASSSAASEGSNIATGTLNGARPSVRVLAAAYYDTRIAIIMINTDGAITVRLSKGSMESSYTVTFGFTFICS